MKGTTTANSGLIGERLGPIRIIAEIGRGGMGVVYSGFHERLQRKVAVKIVREERRLGPVERERFLEEARLLSRLNHPGICAVHDLLETPAGDCLVLEYVEGRTLHREASEGIGRRRALEIGRQLLEVLSEVHRRGIIHRDLKPANIMVQPSGDIKVLDFGLARTVDDRVIAAPLADIIEESDDQANGQTVTRPHPADARLTRAGTLVGTLHYMSPEQARGEEITPATDVYTTGLIIQELLTGEPPFERNLSDLSLLSRAAWGDIRPATGLPSELRSFLARLTSLVPADRPTARDALEHLDRILDLPRRRRKRAAVAATIVVLTALSVGMALQWRRATRETRRAMVLLHETKAVSAFLEGLFQRSDPYLVTKDDPASVSEPTLADLLARGARSIDNVFADQPLVRARFMLLLGGIQRKLGHLEEARDLIESSLALRRENLPENHPDIGTAALELGKVCRDQGDYEHAQPFLEEALAVAESAPGPDRLNVADALEALALIDADQDRRAEARSRYETVLDIRRASQESNLPGVALTLQRLASVDLADGRRDDAEARLTEALTIVRAELGEHHAAAVSLLNEIGRLESLGGREAEAEKNYRQALEIARATLPEDHSLRGTVLTNLASCLDSQDRPAEAESLYREALAIKEDSLGPNHRDTALVLMNLGMAVSNQGRLEEAETLLRRALSILVDRRGSNHPATGICLNALGTVVQERGDLAAARALYERARDAFAEGLGEEHPYVAMTLNNLGEVARLSDSLPAAESLYRRSLAIFEKSLGPNHPLTIDTTRGLAITEGRLGHEAEAEELFQRALTGLQTTGASADQVTADYDRFKRTHGKPTAPKGDH